MKSLALLLPVLVALQVGVQPALAWAWPVDGPVLRPFVLGDDPYARGQHRGIDIGASSGSPVRAPAAGTISFAGTVPTGGKTVTIRTRDGHAVTLLHLGEYSVARGTEVGEGDVVGSVGPSGDAREDQPYVYLGIRLAGDPNGYVDPLGLLPPPTNADEPVQPEPAPDPAPAPASAGGGRGHAAPSGVHPSPAGTHADATKARRVPAAPTAAQPRASTHAARHHGSVQERRPVSKPRTAPAAAWAHEPAAGAGLALVAAPGSGSAAPSSLSRGKALTAATAVFAFGAAAALARRRRELGDARAAHGPSAVLLQRAAAPAEDAGGLRLGQEDHVVLDRDLEGILLPELEALADLDRDDDPAQVVDVADDSRSRCPFGRANRNDSLASSVRPHSFLVSRLPRTLGTSPCHLISNHQSGVRSRRASFV